MDPRLALATSRQQIDHASARLEDARTLGGLDDRHHRVLHAADLALAFAREGVGAVGELTACDDGHALVYYAGGDCPACEAAGARQGGVLLPRDQALALHARLARLRHALEPDDAALIREVSALMVGIEDLLAGRPGALSAHPVARNRGAAS